MHFIDNLGGNLGSFDRIEKSLADGAGWSDFDRGISASAYFGAASRVARTAAKPLSEAGLPRPRGSQIAG